MGFSMGSMGFPKIAEKFTGKRHQDTMVLVWVRGLDGLVPLVQGDCWFTLECYSSFSMCSMCSCRCTPYGKDRTSREFRSS